MRTTRSPPKAESSAILNSFIDGAMLGMLMASAFIVVSMVSLFMFLKRNSAQAQSLFERRAPMTLAMAIVAVAYPTWAVVGGMLGALYRVSLAQAPGGGIGSPNLAYTLAVTLAAVALAAPIALLLRRALAGVLALTLAFIGLFGWFLPYFVSA